MVAALSALATPKQSESVSAEPSDAWSSFGGFEHGWEQIAERLEWASAGIGAGGRRVENLLTVVGEDLACTVDLEHMERTSGGRTYHRVLRCTQVYRLEDGEWKVIVRDADELPEKDSHQR